MRFIIFITISLLFLPLAQAETTFFDQDDAFIMGNLPTTAGVTGGATGGGGGCTYKWNCTNWSECFPSGKQTRNCTNIGTCSNTYKTPEIEQNCTYTAPKIKKGNKELEKENVTEEEETEKENETEEIVEKEIVDKNKIIIYSIIILIIIFVIIYLKKDYLTSSPTLKGGDSS